VKRKKKPIKAFLCVCLAHADVDELMDLVNDFPFEEFVHLGAH
jgi:hypothetical protein